MLVSEGRCQFIVIHTVMSTQQKDCVSADGTKCMRSHAYLHSLLLLYTFPQQQHPACERDSQMCPSVHLNPLVLEILKKTFVINLK